MVSKKSFILQKLAHSPCSFSSLLTVMGKVSRITPDGLESILHGMQKEKLVTPVNGRWTFLRWPAEHKPAVKTKSTKPKSKLLGGVLNA